MHQAGNMFPFSYRSARERPGAPGRIRTADHLVRSQVLYPAELRARGGHSSLTRHRPRHLRDPLAVKAGRQSAPHLRSKHRTEHEAHLAARHDHFVLVERDRVALQPIGQVAAHQ